MGQSSTQYRQPVPWNSGNGVEFFDDGFQHLVLLATERLKVLHVGDVIVKLLFGAHTGEHGEDVIETCAEADSPRRDGKIRILCLHDALISLFMPAREPPLTGSITMMGLLCLTATS